MLIGIFAYGTIFFLLLEITISNKMSTIYSKIDLLFFEILILPYSID